MPLPPIAYIAAASLPSTRTTDSMAKFMQYF